MINFNWAIVLEALGFSIVATGIMVYIFWVLFAPSRNRKEEIIKLGSLIALLIIIFVITGFLYE